MKVSACLVTRGDVDMQPVIGSLPSEWEVIVWDNSGQMLWRDGKVSGWSNSVTDRMGSGRHHAAKFAKGDLIYTQDDDVIVSDPQAIVDEWGYESTARGYMLGADAVNEHIICNMPRLFRGHYPDSAMLGFGSVYHRSLPPAVFARFFATTGLTEDDPLFMRESDRALTVLAPRVLVDVPKQDREFASDANRLYRQPDHIEMRERMLTLARQVRDA